MRSTPELIALMWPWFDGGSGGVCRVLSLSELAGRGLIGLGGERLQVLLRCFKSSLLRRELLDRWRRCGLLGGLAGGTGIGRILRG